MMQALCSTLPFLLKLWQSLPSLEALLPSPWNTQSLPAALCLLWETSHQSLHSNSIRWVPGLQGSTDIFVKALTSQDLTGPKSQTWETRGYPRSGGSHRVLEPRGQCFRFGRLRVRGFRKFPESSPSTPGCWLSGLAPRQASSVP